MNNQMNSVVRKIHNLHSSGAVTITGPNQPRILKQKVAGGVTSTNNLQQVSGGGGANRCYVCDDALSAGQTQHPLTEMQTSHSTTKFPNKIGQLVGDAFMVIVSVEDVVCSRCTNLINYLDRLENDVERVRTNLMNLLHKKYGLNDEGGGGGSAAAASPPMKMQKLNSGTATRTAEDVGELNRTRKLMHAGTDSPLGKQSPPVSAVQQIKISTQPVHQHSAGTQTLQRKTTKIYKCLSCDYKTSDMRLFNTHYETCKQQNFQCKNCKKIFPNFGTMKQHMVREHNTAMDNTCAVCHINFVNETALRKHMELNHSTNVVVTSTTTLPAGANAAADPIGTGNTTTTTPLYTCNHCQFKSTDKALFDEHLRKHLSGVKHKPFKCRLCAQRFETREAATIHAKQHQPNYFKCGTCSMSFPKRELLVKHFEVHQQQAQTTQSQQVVVTQTTTVKQAAPQQQQQQVATQQNMLTTQKLLQDTIDEALSDNVAPASAATADGSAAANDIRFFSCHICSLTFIQENYYNQHMETHRREKKSGVGTASVSATTASHNNNSGGMGALNTAAAALLGDELTAAKSGDNSIGGGNAAAAAQQSNAAADIESIFEEMHSDKVGSTGDAVATSAGNTGTTSTASAAGGAQGSDNLVITSQEGSGGITFNITIPQSDAAGSGEQGSNTLKTAPTATAPVSVGIDMPMLDQPDEVPSSANKTNEKDDKDDAETNGNNANNISASGPVSMPSLDDDNDAHDTTQSHAADTDAAAKEAHAKEGAHDDNQTTKTDDQSHAAETNAESAPHGEHTETTDEHGAAEGHAAATAEEQHEHEQHQQQQQQHHQVAMELDEAMQAQVDSGQIKFILNENGQLLQLDNNIITDADGNQILVQDPEQMQQLLHSVGVLQSGDGLDGETLQMMTDANGQMVLVQGENNETQLIDASLLNADGQLVIQQGQDGEYGGIGTHVIGEDGIRIPVSVSYTADGQPIIQVQQQGMEAAAGEHAQHELDKDAVADEAATTTAAHEGNAAAEAGEAQIDADAANAGGASVNADGEPANANVAGNAAAGSSGGSFFALEELMQQTSTEGKAAE